jgi:hypothetical protein
VLVTLDKPNVAMPIQSAPKSLYDDLGIDRIALVNVERINKSEVRIRRITDVSVYDNGDSTTAKRALDLIIREGRLQSFVDTSLCRK